MASAGKLYRIVGTRRRHPSDAFEFWFGVLSMTIVAMGLVCPPVGLLAFIVSATAGVGPDEGPKGISILMLAIVAPRCC